MEHCNICNKDILKKNFKRHESSQKHLVNLQNYIRENYVPENILDTDINEPNIQEPIQSTIYKPKKEKRNKKIYEKLKRELLNEFDILERNHEDISPQKIKKQLKKYLQR
jgi:hypothetical protein